MDKALLLSMRLLLSIAIFATVSTASVSQARSTAGELTLPPALMHEINQVLKTSTVFHKALMSQDEEQIEICLRDVLWELDRARATSSVAKPHERNHLIRILDAAREQFTLTQNAYGEERRARLEDGFNQLVNLVRIYKVDRNYGIFFCPKDRTTWVQTGSRAQNPFHAKVTRDPCGIKVTR